MENQNGLDANSYTMPLRIFDWVAGTVAFNRLAVVIEGTNATWGTGRSGTTEMVFQGSMLLALIIGGIATVCLISAARRRSAIGSIWLRWAVLVMASLLSVLSLRFV